MADECEVSRVVTTFLLNTCRLRPWASIRDVQAAMICGVVASKHSWEDAELFIPLITGSVAEFYIEPMLPHVGDVDVMYYCNIYLAIPRGHTPPELLPAEFHNYVYVAEIIDSQFPGYVYLSLRYLLTQRVDVGKYRYIEYDESLYLPIRAYLERCTGVHGPAVVNNPISQLELSVDTVRCTRCLSWPPQAVNWPTRYRNYGWPDSATLDLVVTSGCDVVHAAHRQCKQHELMITYQWRLSFSRAEIVLINSWMPVQQIAYHILRVYAKTERLTESVDNSEPAIMSNYHIKTLMLWACELKPKSWWTEKLNLVRICAELLNTLSVWLSDTRCPHYFVSNWNLLDISLSDATVASKLISIDKTYLSTWLINNYIAQCAQLCASHITLLFDDVSTDMKKLQHVVSDIVHWRLNTSLFDMWRALEFVEFYIQQKVSVYYSLTSRSCAYWMNDLSKIDKRLSVYFSAVALLNVARKISKNGFSDELVDILTIFLGHNFIQSCSCLSRCKTELNVSELVEILQKSAVEHLTTYRHLQVQDFRHVVTIETTDYEALYAYKQGNYQRCLQLSTQNVHALYYARSASSIPIYPELIQLLDDDIVSLIAMMLMVNRKCRYNINYTCITQLTLSLYLMTQCQLKLHHSVTSLVQTLDYIKISHSRHPRERTLDQLTLKLIKHKAYVTTL